MNRIAIALACLLPLGALAADSKKSFEVASVKPSTPISVGDMHNFRILTGPRFGPGTEDATRWVCDNCSLGMLLASAYDLKRFQITAPKWIDSEKFDIAARVAPGATREDLRAMQQNLLAERFGLKARLEKKEMQVYDLVVAKNPPKLLETAASKPAASPSHDGHSGPSAVSAPSRAGAAPAFGERNSGRTFTMNMHGNTRHQAVGESMQELADVLAGQLEKPVTDSTGLTGKYDFL
ncbi:MAG: TIGR03435 family protein, partial [Candidatus Solibacter sp.]